MSDNILNSALSYIADFLKKYSNNPVVIEEGNKGIWHYRLYNDNFLQAWGKANVSIKQYATVDTLKAYQTSITLPFTMTDANSYNLNHNWKIASGHACPSTAFNRTTTSATLCALSTTDGSSTAQSCMIDIYLTGYIADQQ